MSWLVETLDHRVDDELSGLPSDMRARLVRIVELIEEVGLERLRGPQLKHLEGSLWEMRVSGRAGIGRGIYVTAHGRRVIILRVFIKKTERTPRREIEIALARAKEVR